MLDPSKVYFENLEEIISENAQQAIWTLQNAGFEACIVGGAVRDIIMEKQPHDFDITTNATPDEIRKVFSGFPIINNNGEKHGTVTVHMNHENIEITTYRIDLDYFDGRHPSNVYYTRDLKQDLGRRDFTINAIAYDLSEFKDPFNGIEDIKNEIIRTVGNPVDRFNEDALRILRGIRFASKLGFSIEPETLSAMVSLREKLKVLSAERIREELNQIVCGKYSLKVLMNPNVQIILAEILPDIVPMLRFDQHNKYHKHDLWNHTACVIDGIKNKNYITCIAALLHDIGKPFMFQPYLNDDFDVKYHFIEHPSKSKEIAEVILKALKYSNDDIEKILWLVEKHDNSVSNSKRVVRKFLASFPKEEWFEELFDCWCDLRQSDAADHVFRDTVNYRDFQKFCSEVLKEHSNPKRCYDLKKLAVNGYDIMEIGYRGKEIGDILEELLEEVMNEDLINDKDSLLAYARRRYDEFLQRK